jgi:hypothetical protein
VVSSVCVGVGGELEQQLDGAAAIAPSTTTSSQHGQAATTAAAARSADRGGGKGSVPPMWQVEDEAILPSGYSVDLLLLPDGVTGTTEATAVEIDGPSHFLHASRVPRGETVRTSLPLPAQ